MKPVFIPLSEEHRNDVMDIFNYYAENSFAAYLETKQPVQVFDKFLENAKKYPAYIIKQEDCDEVIGYCLLRPYMPMQTFNESAEIGYIIKNDYVGQGIGTAALIRLENDAKGLGIKNLIASVVSLNELSIRFHEKNGFTQCGTLKAIGRKFGHYFDVVWMQKVIA